MKNSNTANLIRAWGEAAKIDTSSASIQILTQSSRLRKFDAGHYLIEQGESSDSVFLILKGSLKVSWFTRNGHEIWLADLEAGELVGESAALCNSPRTSSVIARSTVVLAEVAFADFRTALASSSEFALSFAELLAKRVQATSQQVIGLVGLPLASRLHAELQRRGAADNSDNERIILESPPSVSLLAEQIHASREATSRAMSALLKRGLVSKTKDFMHVIVPQD